MDYQSLLAKEARDRGLALTPLAQMGRYSHSVKVPCCGGVVVRVETESSADSTVCLRDESGTCFCALHGDLCSLYPDVLTAGAVLCLTNVTLLVTSAKMPPLLVVCLENLTALMLPDTDAAEVVGAPRPSDRPMGAALATAGPESLAVMEGSAQAGAGADQTGRPAQVPPAASAPARVPSPPRQLAPSASPAAYVKAEVVSDDDEDCLELVDDL